ncbi:hypothetical protein [Chryseobacterium echinoideorum]|uniref:hypothetical protein n=1 Tax=Chryseobacterium echinoideorum TaxID=1549648 RepID=UPI001186A030|nr:hypothetical protein [Chryseobacterium echinoideorum]
MKRLFIAGAIYVFINSCATEKPNLSPLTDSGTVSNSESSKGVNINITGNINASEITNLISSFPKFSNSALNEEITVLKYTLQNYLYAVESGNISGKKKAIKNLEKSYKSIQKLRRFLKKDDDEVLNRYLVRLKTNVSVIEDSVNGKK